MNLSKFLKKVDALTAECEREQLIGFIHDTARKLSETQRQDFLDRLQCVLDDGQPEQTDLKQTVVEQAKKETTAAYEQIDVKLSRVEEGEISIEEFLNEMYDEWYNSDEEEFYYEDPDGVCDIVSEAVQFVHTCADRECYEEGFRMGQRILDLYISVSSEYGTEDFTLQDLVSEELLSINYDKFILDVVYCIYYTVSGQERPKVIYGFISEAKTKDFRLERLMQYGDEELEDFDLFLDNWIAYLGTIPAVSREVAQDLFAEAVDLKNDLTDMLNLAKTYVSTQPGLYLKLLSKDMQMNDNDMLQIGLEALDLMDCTYEIRSAVALKTAEYAQKTGQSETAAYCYIESFRSQAAPLNYLRACLNGCDTEDYQKKLRDIFQSDLLKMGAEKYGCSFQIPYEKLGTAKYYPSKNEMYMIQFLDGQFMDVLKRGLGVNNALGWSSTFMKTGLALFCIYLYEGENEAQGIQEMIGKAAGAFSFTKEQYAFGLFEVFDGDDLELFWKCFLSWKKMHPISEEDASKIISHMSRRMEKRVQGIMENNRRNYYRECAAFIAAIGEVMESRGDVGAKQRYMTSFKEKYPRRSAFRQELQAFGWKNR